MDDPDPFLQAIDDRLADIAAADAAARAPLDDATRARAIESLVESMLLGNTDAAHRVALIAAKLGPRFAELVEDIIANVTAKREAQALARRTAVATDTGEGDARIGAPPRGHDAPIPEGHGAGEAIEPMSRRQPVEPPRSPWYEDKKWRPGLQRADQLKRLWSKPDTSPDAGSGWMKRSR
jgi:hypothetical protein